MTKQTFGQKKISVIFVPKKGSNIFLCGKKTNFFPVKRKKRILGQFELSTKYFLQSRLIEKYFLFLIFRELWYVYFLNCFLKKDHLLYYSILCWHVFKENNGHFKDAMAFIDCFTQDFFSYPPPKKKKKTILFFFSKKESASCFSFCLLPPPF